MPLLSQLLALPLQPLIAIVGAGGKTTTMYTLADELAGQGKRVITTTTTNIFIPKRGETDTFIVSPQLPRLLGMVAAAWKQHRRVTVAASPIASGKLAGLLPDQPYELLVKGGADAVIVEADGARHLMIKAPAEHEPVIPAHTNLALLLMSAEALNQPLSPEIAHRPEQVASVMGLNSGDLMTPAHIARLVTSEQGMLKHIPETAPAYLLLTHAAAERQQAMQELAALVRRSSCIAGVFASAEPGEWFVVE
jgi:probable selenium-dependent hydroxylase accessory protein YqeC